MIKSFKIFEAKLETDLVKYAKEGNLKKVKDLIKAGANVNAYSRNRTALFVAAEKDHHLIVRELLNAGADPNLIIRHNRRWGTNDTTALVYAAQAGALNTIKEFIKCDRTDLNAADFAGLTAILRAEWVANDIIKTLIEGGADPNIQDVNGTNILMQYCGIHPAGYKDLDFIRYLLSLDKIDLSATQYDGRDVFDIIEDDEEILEIFDEEFQKYPERYEEYIIKRSSKKYNL